MDFIHHYQSPLGDLTLASDGNALTGIWFDRALYRGDFLSANSTEQRLPIFEQTDKWLDIYFSGKEPPFTPPLSIHTTDFRKAVWEILLTIPYGKTMTYGEIAKQIAMQKGLNRMSAQAVGGAVGHNAFVLIIPCHRVIGADGSLTGYGPGLDIKAKLLEMERTWSTK